MSDNVRRLAWMRGYIVIIHGGGATGITQTNDTDLHQHQRRLYTEKEMAEMLRLEHQPRQDALRDGGVVHRLDG